MVGDERREQQAKLLDRIMLNKIYSCTSNFNKAYQETESFNKIECYSKNTDGFTEGGQEENVSRRPKMKAANPL